MVVYQYTFWCTGTPSSKVPLKTHHMATPGQTMHKRGQYGSPGVQGMLHITTFHSDGHAQWALARGSQGYHSTRTGLVGAKRRTIPHLDTINMKPNKIKHCMLTRDPIGAHHIKDLSGGGHTVAHGCDSGLPPQSGRIE